MITLRFDIYFKAKGGSRILILNRRINGLNSAIFYMNYVSQVLIVQKHGANN
jgi:hypothetical protein